MSVKHLVRQNLYSGGGDGVLCLIVFIFKTAMEINILITFEDIEKRSSQG